MLIGLTGAAGAGKDTAASFLTLSGFRSVAFADALRVEIAASYHIDPRLLIDRAGKEQPHDALRVGNATTPEWLHYCAVQGWSVMSPRSPRWTLQAWGEWRRQQHTDHWVRHVLAWMQHQHQRGHHDLVVTDVRHPNEAEALRLRGGHVVRVHRPGMVPLGPETAGHASEQHWQIVADAHIHNDGSFGELAAEVWRCVRDLADRRPAADPSTTTA